MGRAKELEKRLEVPAHDNPLKWRRVVDEYRRVFERELFRLLVDLNREVLGKWFSVLCLAEEAAEQEALLAIRASPGD